MGYEDEDKQMSCYGKQYVNPGEVDGRWKELVRTETVIIKGHKVNRENSTTFSEDERSMTYFGTNKEHERTSSYDQTFKIPKAYNAKTHRDDREYTIGLDVHAEEANRVVPILSSSSYGRRADKPFEDPATLRKHVRIEHVLKGFYRNRGAGISHEEMHNNV